MDESITNAVSEEDIATSVAATMSGKLKRDRSSGGRSSTADVQHKEKKHRRDDILKDNAAIATDQYTVGWVCALPLEMAASKGMLDQIHPDLSTQDSADHNCYILGQVQSHNVVIACLPAGIYGLTSAATVAKDMLRTFKSIRFGLMVGIGGGAPSTTQDIRLGDVVVSQPSGTSGGVIQYDRGKTVQEAEFQSTGSLNTPPQILLTALSRLQTDHLSEESKVPYLLSELRRKSPRRMKEKFDFQGTSNDYLFQAEYDHTSPAATCDQCDRTQLVPRDPRADTDPVVHYGTIASGNQVIKHGKTRERLSKIYGALCFEMEAAGLQDFPCLIVRGICDYADSHKNKVWQEYAAATAAAFAKELLLVIRTERVLQEEPIPQLVSDPRLQELMSSTKYEHFKNLNPDRVRGTCKWVLEHSQYTRWFQSPCDDLLWISADPGCGKSVLAKSLIDQELQNTDKHTVCYFFFKDNEEQNSLAKALSALLHQYFSVKPELLEHAIDAYNKNGDKLRDEVDELWRILIAATSDERASNVTCVLDALDECRANDRQKLIQNLTDFYACRAIPSTRSWVKFLVTSRPYIDIQSGFSHIPPNLPSIRLAGEEHNADISEEINLVIEAEVQKAGREYQLDQNRRHILQERLLETSSRTYLWLHLVVKELPNLDKTTKKAFQADINLLPQTVEEVYERILSRHNIKQRTKAQKLLHIIVGARRPLTLQELFLAYQIAIESPNAEAHEDLELDHTQFGSRIRDLCGLFVFVNDSRVYLIHQTAKEFLVLKDSSASSANRSWAKSLNSQCSDTIMTQICVRYLCLKEFSDDSFTTNGKEPTVDKDIHILFEYSAVHWPAHLRNATSNSRELQRRILSLYDMDSPIFKIWVSRFWEAHYYDSEVSWVEIDNIHLAATNGHTEVLGELLDSEPAALDSRDGKDQTPLIWSCREGQEKTVRMLLNKGAEVNTQGGYDGNALQAASYGGHERIVQMLLDKGAGVNAQGGYYGNALQAASYGGHERIVQMLLDKGAEVSAQGGYYGNAFQAASYGGHEKTVRMLLDKGAEAV